MQKSKPKKTLILICNAHLDPVWQWEWSEGAAEALSTFRTAVRLCENYGTFIFNHNEAVLYEWIEEYEPPLFERIKRLIEQGRWHIMGGWYLQPDCNLPSTEALIRQILVGRRYFSDKFAVAPTTAINFDPFGHAHGLVQLLVKSGYNAYLHCRPGAEYLTLPADTYLWQGPDGSQVTAHREYLYNTPLGKAREALQRRLHDETYSGTQVDVLLWGVGNHGGGASQKDIEELNQLIQECAEVDVVHGTPESYFERLRQQNHELPIFTQALNRFAPGCYTSQIRIKQTYRQLENEYFATEKMLSHAALNDLLHYPAQELQQAQRDLLFAQFHDILPGSSIKPVEEYALRLMAHALEILSRLKTRAFFALSAGQPSIQHNEYPILVYNPHPYELRQTVECEFQLQDQNWEEGCSIPSVMQHGQVLPSQLEKEQGNIPLDWRKRIVFEAVLSPSQMNRFDVTIVDFKPGCRLPVSKNPCESFHFDNGMARIVINRHTGLVDAYSIHEQEFLQCNAFCPLIIQDDDDSWGMNTRAYRHVIGSFSLLDAARQQKILGLDTAIDTVRIVEDGAVRTVIETILGYADSHIIVHYLIPKHGTDFEIRLSAFWNEQRKMLKWSIPTMFVKARCEFQALGGREQLTADGQEQVMQKWLALVDEEQHTAFACINDGIYGFDSADGELRLSLLRSPVYTGHPLPRADGTMRSIVPQDRYVPRMDQGERHYRFKFIAGAADSVLRRIGRAAQCFAEQPYALACNPSGMGQRPLPSVILDDGPIEMLALKQAEASNHLLIRLFNPTAQPETCRLRLPTYTHEESLVIPFAPFEIKSFIIDRETRSTSEVDLLENVLVSV
jgi:alpha-mannosidase